jgi:hypothetical protein
MSFPTSPFNGQLTIVNGINYIYNSTLNAWVRAPFSNYTASTTPPNNPTVGSLWYKTDTDVLYEYLSDGTDYYWFDMSTQSLAANTGGIQNYLGESFAGNLTISGNITGSLGYMLEKTDFSAGAPTATTDFDLLTSPIKFFTANATTNFVANLRGDATTPLNSIVANGQAVTFSISVPQAAPYTITAVNIDNFPVPIAWQGFSAVVIGNANSIDLYTFTAVKGGQNNWRILGSQTTYTHYGSWTNYQSVVSSVEMLVIAGGGSGGTSYGGGGGAGGVRVYAIGSSVGSGDIFTVTVGAGGAARSTNSALGASGSNSSVVVTGGSSITITANGGGYGASQSSEGGAGGSGGGGGSNNASLGGAGNTPSISPSQGFAGGQGSGTSPVRGAGGGGGAGGVGANGTSTAGGAGGVGTNTYSTWATATSTGVGGYYAGGGGGGAISGTNVGGAGGSGGGGAGGSGNNNSGTAGTPNTGGGGGGMGDRPSSGSSGAGGSGIVIIRYSTLLDAATSTTGSPTITVSGGYRYYTFTGDGSLTM